MATKERENRGNRKPYLMMLFSMLIGAACGLYIVNIIDFMLGAGKPIGEIVLSVAGLLAGICMAFLLQIILHEAGHWLFGRMTGYRFLHSASAV